VTENARTLKVNKKTPFTRKPIEDFFRLLLDRADSERSWTVECQTIEDGNYDLKAVNSNAKTNEDTRASEELPDLIAAKGPEVSEAPAELRTLSRLKAAPPPSPTPSIAWPATSWNC
jgi:type I restriction enzyme M protein